MSTFSDGFLLGALFVTACVLGIILLMIHIEKKEQNK